MSYVIQTTNLAKTYQNKDVISNVTMNIEKGEIYGFLGPNGSGKTTTMKMMLNLVKPTQGDVIMFDEKVSNDSYEMFKRIGNMIGHPAFYDKLTAYQNLEIHCEYMGYYNKEAIERALEMVNLTNVDDKPVKQYSLGMRQRLGIARAIVAMPELLILDEPLNGLDPVGIKEMRKLFKMLNKEYGMTILMSSHILAEIEQIANTIGIIKEGQLIREVQMDHIRSENVAYIELHVNDPSKASFILDQVLKIKNFKLLEDNTIRIYETAVEEGEITKQLILGDVLVTKMMRKENSLEDYFMKIVNGGGAIA